MPLAVSVQPLHHYPIRRISHVHLPKGNYIYCGVKVRLGSLRLGTHIPPCPRESDMRTEIKTANHGGGSATAPLWKREDVCLQFFENSPRISFLTGFWQLWCSTFCRVGLTGTEAWRHHAEKTRRKPGSEWKPEKTRSVSPFRSGHHSGPACPFHSGTWTGQVRSYHLLMFFK